MFFLENIWKKNLFLFSIQSIHLFTSYSLFQYFSRIVWQNMNSNILRKYLSSYNTKGFYERKLFDQIYGKPLINCDKNQNLFNDRICDDLCEVILNYLPIEEKFRLESVSKQFQRCIFNKQTVIELKGCDQKKNNRKNLYNCLVLTANSRYINIKAFESLLKKCRYCNDFRFKSYLIANREEVLESVIKYCRYLKSISFDFNEISGETVLRFGLKFGENLQKLCFVFSNPVISVDNYILLFRLCPNLLTLNKVKLKHVIAANELLVPKIRSIDMFYGKTDTKYVTDFVEKHKNSLKSLKINTEVNGDILNHILQEIQNFKNLEKLEIWSTARVLTIDSEFIRNINRIGIECKRLKYFKLMTNKVNQTNVSKLFQSLNTYHSVKYLDLRLLFRLKLDSNQSVALKWLSACSQIESIHLNYCGLNDRLFEDIGLHFHRLKRLSLTVDQITDKAMKSLSKLKSLKYLSLDVHHSRSVGFPLVTDSGLCHVIYHCPNIESIIFFGRPNITIVTINALILLALSKPKVSFNHYFGFIERKFSTEYTPIELAFLTNLPKNMIISTELSTYFA